MPANITSMISVVNPHHFDADLNWTFHPAVDPDPDPSFKKRLKPLKKCENRLIFHTFWRDICKLMLIRIRFRIQLFIDANPDFYLMRMWIQVTKMLLIIADPDPQHCP
jgi:hypothetical protein